MSKKLPIVAIVGRANVGKSSLFNRLVAKRQAIVADEPGTTRDSIYGLVEVGERAFWVVDTAGLKAPEDEFEATIQEQINQATESADIIVVVAEAPVGVTEEDRRVAKLALKSKKDVALAINKIDKAKKQDISEFVKLGIKNSFEISATHNEGVDELTDAILSQMPRVYADTKHDELTIALLGRPNVGKSSLFNTIAKKQQAVVADVAGTTRDVNTASVKWHKRDVTILDTAGMRRPGKIGKGIEHFSVLRALAAIEQADVCVLLMDANELNTNLDQKIAGMISDAGKGLILAVSKWDSREKDAWTAADITKQISYHFQFVPWAPLVFTSAETGQNVTKLFELAHDIDTRRKQEFKTTELNRWLQSITDHHPPAGLKNTQPKLRYIAQSDQAPPSFKIFGKDTKYLHWSYKRYMMRELREKYPLEGTPVKFYFSDKTPDGGKK